MGAVRVGQFGSGQVETVFKLGWRLVTRHLGADGTADGGLGIGIDKRRSLPRVGSQIIQHGAGIRKAALAR